MTKDARVPQHQELIVHIDSKLLLCKIKGRGLPFIRYHNANRVNIDTPAPRRVRGVPLCLTL